MTTSGGVDQLPKPSRVVWLSDDGTHLRVHGSMTGIPVAEVSVAEPPSAAPITRSEGWVKGENDLNVLQRGDRLEIIANVDLDGLQNLKEVLTHYENILRLLSPKPPKKEENGK